MLPPCRADVLTYDDERKDLLDLFYHTAVVGRSCVARYGVRVGWGRMVQPQRLRSHDR